MHTLDETFMKIIDIVFIHIFNDIFIRTFDAAIFLHILDADKFMHVLSEAHEYNQLYNRVLARLMRIH